MDDIEYINKIVWWVEKGTLAGMPMPYLAPERRLNQNGNRDAFKDDLPLLFKIGLRSVVCPLNLPSDEAIYKEAGFDLKDIYKFIKEASKGVVVNCEGGIGRTGTILAAYYIMDGLSLDHAISKVRFAEPTAIESPEQFKFLENLSKVLH